MKPLLLTCAFAALLNAKPVPPAAAKAAAPPALAPCDARQTPAGFAYPVPGLEEFLAPAQLDPAYAGTCRDRAALAAQHYGERLQTALRNIWPQAGAAVLAMVERVSIASPTPALVKFCFIGKEGNGDQSIACGEVIFRLSDGSLELRLAGREAVTSAQAPEVEPSQGPRAVSAAR